MSTPGQVGPDGFVAADSQSRRDEYDITRVGTENRQTTDVVSIEEPLEIRLVSGGAESPLTVTMRTPGHDHELALGFLFGEGIIRSAKDCRAIAHSRPPSPDRGLHNVICIELDETIDVDPATLARHFYTTSSCGVCGKTSIEAVTATMPAPVSNTLSLPRELLMRLPASLRERQSEFDRTGGMHAAGLIDPEGNLVGVREDVGRHNAVDKVIGSMLLASQLPLAGHGLMLSGRASFELLQKAAMAGIELVAAIGAPSSLAIDLAREKGITLAGFVNEAGFNVYSHPGRLRT